MLTNAFNWVSISANVKTRICLLEFDGKLDKHVKVDLWSRMLAAGNHKVWSGTKSKVRCSFSYWWLFFLHWRNPHRIPCSLHREIGRSIGLTYMRETREFKEHIQQPHVCVSNRLKSEKSHIQIHNLTYLIAASQLLKYCLYRVHQS